MITFWRIIKYGFVNFWRNGLLSLATTLVLTLTLFTISVFVSLSLLAGAAIESVNSRIDVVAYFEDEVAENKIMEIEKEAQTLLNVRETEYISKEEAFDRWQGRDIDESLRGAITKEDNPLPRSLEIRVKNPEKTDEIAQFFDREDISSLVHRVRYNKEMIDKLVSYTSSFKKIGYGLIAIFLVISVFVVFNTIRLAIYSRRDEISIMKLVGATPSYIRWPFIVEGTLFGIFAAILASAVVIFGGRYIIQSGLIPINSDDIMNFLGSDAAAYFSGRSFQIVLYQIIVGIVLSIICSLVAIRRYLKL